MKVRVTELIANLYEYEYNVPEAKTLKEAIKLIKKGKFTEAKEIGMTDEVQKTIKTYWKKAYIVK